MGEKGTRRTHAEPRKQPSNEQVTNLATYLAIGMGRTSEADGRPETQSSSKRVA
jgi:hypothetical protein